jgi:inner membrane protein
MFFYSPLLIALTVIGANIPDFDHEFKQEHVYKMIILGLVVFISLYILKLPYYLGLIIVFLGVCFYFSEHRSFTHSIFGVLILTACVALILIWSFQLVIGVADLDSHYFVMAVLIALLGFLFLNRKVLIIFLPLFFIGLMVLPQIGINYMLLISSIFLGLFSHMVLDSFTPAGIKIFAPLSQRKVYKNFGLMCILMLVVLSIVYHAPVLFNLFENYVSI